MGVDVAQGALGLAKVALGMDQAGEVVEADRQKACQACAEYRPHVMFGWNWAQCGLCHCFVGPKVKLASARCPSNPPKWTSVQAV